MWEELLKDVGIIKWSVICIAVSLWGLTAYFLLKEIPKWWHSYNKKRALDRMKKDLAGAERPRRQKVYKNANDD